MTIIEQFLKLGNSASFHYADDSGGEWGSGKRDEHAATFLYMTNPLLQHEMKKQASFLWSIDRAVINWERNNGKA